MSEVLKEPESGESNKAQNSMKAVVRPLTEVGQPRIVTSSRYIQDLRHKDLIMPRRLCTFDNMMLDDAVANSVDVTNIQTVSALSTGKFHSTGSRVSDAATDFLNYNIRNLDEGTWLEAMNNAATDLTYGFSLANIVLKKATMGKYKGSYTLSKLAPRDQKSVYGWVWDKYNRDLKGFVQKPMIGSRVDKTLPNYINNISMDTVGGGYYSESRYPFLSKEKVLHFRHNPTNSDPQGNSPLIACYDAWTEKKLVEHYEVIGVSKDFGGLVVIRIPSELIEKASKPELYPEAYQEYKALQEDAKNLQQGKSTHMVLTSDTGESGKPLYDLELKGIQGTGTQYNTENIINQKRKSIYNIFGTGFLLLGQNGHGSNALASSQMSTHDYYIKRCIDWKVDVINTQLATRLLSANNYLLDWKDMPTFIPADPSKVDFDTMSKVMQRAGSVDLLSDKAIEDIYDTLGFNKEGLEEHLNKRGEQKQESRAGESLGTSGTGSTQANGGSSSLNSENKSMEHFEVDYETDSELIAVNIKDGTPISIQKES